MASHKIVHAYVRARPKRTNMSVSMSIHIEIYSEIMAMLKLLSQSQNSKSLKVLLDCVSVCVIMYSLSNV